MTTPLYFGCWDVTGHGLHAPGGAPRCYYTERARLRLPLDGGYPPQRPERDRYRMKDADYQPQGAALLHHEDERTILAFWDRTVDHRCGSHSTFLLPGALDFAAAVAAARAAFPHVWRRLDSAGVIVRPL